MGFYYKRNLPHYQPAGAEYWITMRLKGSLPRHLLEQFDKQYAYERNKRQSKAGKRAYERKKRRYIHRLLDEGNHGPTWLTRPEIAENVIAALHYRDEKEYELYAYTVMSNHLHLVFQHRSEKLTFNRSEKDYPVTEILGNFKRYTSRQANKILGRTGAFWQHESYDHVIRNAVELERIILYTLNNPVHVNLVSRWQDWPYSYCKPEWAKYF